MKQTDLRFQLRLVPGDPRSILNSLEAKLRVLKGINSVTVTGNHDTAALTLNASFEDAEQAKQLHRKVMNTIIAHDGVTVSEVATKLTDIF